MPLDGIEDFDDQSTDIPVAAAISRYWKQQGYKVNVIVGQGTIRSNLRFGVPPAIVGKMRLDSFGAQRGLTGSRPSDLESYPAGGSCSSGRV